MGNMFPRSPCAACGALVIYSYEYALDASPKVLDTAAQTLAQYQGVRIPIHDVPTTRVVERVRLCRWCVPFRYRSAAQEMFEARRAQVIVDQWREAMPKCAMCECPHPWRVATCPGTQIEHQLQAPERTVSIQLD